MRRRAFLAGLGGAVLATPLAVRAQQGERRRVIGLLLPADDGSRRRGLLTGLERLGYREGQNFTLEVRSADGKLDRLPSLAGELVRAGVDVIVALNTPGTQAAIDTKTQIPIVMALVGDPVGSGFVANLNRPGGSVTGASNAVGEIAGKRFAVLKQAIPAARRIAVFTHPDDPVRIPQLRQVEEASRALAVETKVFPVVDASDDIERTIAAAVEWKADAVFRIAAQGAVIFAKLQADLLLRNRLPGMFTNRIDVEHGGLMSYVADFSEHWNQVAGYVDRILKGANPGELPVVLPAKFQFVLNLKTARALGLTIPPGVLAIADEVIE
jgi:putative tryptophan/tyrosine transport system substrate-binding protein